MNSQRHHTVNRNALHPTVGINTTAYQPLWILSAKPQDNHLHSQLRYIPPDKTPEKISTPMMSSDEAGKFAEWSIEVEFLVAKERNNAVQTTDKRWACPADARNPYETCAKRCAEIIHQYGTRNLNSIGGVAYRGEVAPLEDANFQTLKSSTPRPGLCPSMCHWFFSPAPNVVPNRSSPGADDWIGLKMRCPFRAVGTVLQDGDDVLKVLQTSRPVTPKQSSRHGSSSHASSGSASSDSNSNSAPPPTQAHRLEMETLIGMLRGGIKMHTNSSCQLRYYFTNRPDGMDLTQAKRMVALAWMLERDLFLALRPDVRDRESNHFLPISTSSHIAKWKSKFPDGYMKELPARCDELLAETKPDDIVEQASLDTNIPKLNDSCLQERINMIWCATGLPELAESIKSPDGETTVAIHVPRDTQLHPILEMRYTVWHPQAESMQYWLQLFGRLFYFACGAPMYSFKEVVAEMDVNILAGQKLEKEDRWKPLLNHGFDNEVCYYWEQLKRHEREGGTTSIVGLDTRGILKPVPSIPPRAPNSRSSSS